MDISMISRRFSSMIQVGTKELKVFKNCEK